MVLSASVAAAVLIFELPLLAVAAQITPMPPRIPIASTHTAIISSSRLKPPCWALLVELAVASSSLKPVPAAASAVMPDLHAAG